LFPWFSFIRGHLVHEAQRRKVSSLHLSNCQNFSLKYMQASFCIAHNPLMTRDMIFIISFSRGHLVYEASMKKKSPPCASWFFSQLPNPVLGLGVYCSSLKWFRFFLFM
jgi:hypothetical protein